MDILRLGTVVLYPLLSLKLKLVKPGVPTLLVLLAGIIAVYSLANIILDILQGFQDPLSNYASDAEFMLTTFSIFGTAYLLAGFMVFTVKDVMILLVERYFPGFRFTR
jgi:surface polysaccharide O-acyltransferase-like enzyme